MPSSISFSVIAFEPAMLKAQPLPVSLLMTIMLPPVFRGLLQTKRTPFFHPLPLAGSCMGRDSGLTQKGESTPHWTAWESTLEESHTRSFVQRHQFRSLLSHLFCEGAGSRRLASRQSTGRLNCGKGNFHLPRSVPCKRPITPCGIWGEQYRSAAWPVPAGIFPADWRCRVL